MRMNLILSDRYSGWNIGQSLRSRIQETEYAVEAHWLTPSEKIQEGAISREDYIEK
jgi:hypothetical protein